MSHSATARVQPSQANSRSVTLWSMLWHLSAMAGGHSRLSGLSGHGHRGLHDIMATLAKKTDQKASTGV